MGDIVKLPTPHDMAATGSFAVLVMQVLARHDSVSIAGIPEWAHAAAKQLLDSAGYVSGLGFGELEYGPAKAERIHPPNWRPASILPNIPDGTRFSDTVIVRNKDGKAGPGFYDRSATGEDPGWVGDGLKVVEWAPYTAFSKANPCEPEATRLPWRDASKPPTCRGRYSPTVLVLDDEGRVSAGFYSAPQEHWHHDQVCGAPELGQIVKWMPYHALHTAAQ